jgi:hypothetical protein
MAVELRNRLAQIGLNVPISSLLDNPSVNDLLSYLLRQFAKGETHASPLPLGLEPIHRELHPESADVLLQDLDGLSDEEITTLLATLDNNAQCPS